MRYALENDHSVSLSPNSGSASLKPVLFAPAVEALVNAAVDSAAEAAADAAAAETARTEAEAARDTAVDISNIDTPDALVSTLVSDEVAGPLTTAALGAEYAKRNGDKGRAGRGMVSITYDDAEAVHFTEILPISKAMGFPCATAWVTGNGRDAEVAEAWEAGWEIISHSVAHGNMTTLTEAQLKADAEAAVAAISAITGDTRNIGFVYPAHNRNATTDRILSRYYTWGRGVSTNQQGAAGGHPWLVSAQLIDTGYDASGNLTEDFKADLRTLARSNGRMSLYGHYQNETAHPGGLVALVNLVNYVRSLGIEIVTPSVLRGPQELSQAKTASTANWSMTAKWSADATVNIRGSEPSFKYTPNTTGGGFATGTLTAVRQVPVFPESGKFTVCRASFRYKVGSAVTISSGWGFELGASVQSRPVDGGSVVTIGMGYHDTKFPTSGTTIPAGDWALVSRVIALGPDVTAFFPSLMLNNVAEAQPSVNVADLRFDWLDSASALSYTATLNGTTGVNVVTDVLHIGRYAVTITPMASTAGRIYYTIPTATDTTVRVFSTDATDTTQQVRVTVHPLGSYSNYTLATDGA